MDQDLRVRSWEHFEQIPHATAAEELQERRNALARFQEPVGKWEGDDYRALGGDPDESATDALTRLHREYREHAADEEYNPVDVIRMHGINHMGDDGDDSDDDDDDDEEEEDVHSERERQHGMWDAFHPYDQAGNTRFDDEGEVFVHTELPGGIYIPIPIDDGPLSTELDLPDPIAVPVALQVALSEESNDREIEFTAAMEYLQEYAATLPEDQAQRLRDAARLHAHAYLRYPASMIFGWREAARHLGNVRSQSERDTAAEADRLWDTINTERATLEDIRPQIAQWTSLWNLATAIWNRDNPQDAAAFIQFRRDVHRSLEGNRTPVPGLDFTILCWGLGVLPNMPDLITQAIRRLARLHCKRVQMEHHIRKVQRRAFMAESRNIRGLVDWLDTDYHKAEEAFMVSQDAILALQVQPHSGRIGYEPRQDEDYCARLGLTIAEHLAKGLSVSEKVDIIYKRLSVRKIRLAQASLDPVEVQDIAGRTHALAALRFFIWIDWTLKGLRLEHGLEGDDLHARSQLCNDLLVVAEGLQFPDASKKFMELASNAIRDGLVSEDWLVRRKQC